MIITPCQTSGRKSWMTANPSAGIAVLIILSTLIALWLNARAHDFLVCDMECGETLLSFRAVDQFSIHGMRFGLLEVLGSDDAPLIYTHSVNIGTLSFVLLHVLNIDSPAVLVLLPLAAYGLGLLYVFLCVRRVTHSDLAALATLAVFSVTYWGLGAFAANALRAWHLPAFFAITYHGIGILHANGRVHRGNLVGLAFGALFAFGCGYDFWIICGATALALLAFRSSSFRQAAQALFGIGIAFAFPFVLRQIQVAWTLGIDYWWQDILFSLAIKIPYVEMLIPLPPMEEIDAWYLAHHVLRPPASAGNPLWLIFYTFRHMVAQITLPRWGWTALAILVFAAISPLHPRIRRTLTGQVSLCLVLPMLVGMAMGLTLLAPFSIHVYFKHEFPLFAFPLLLAKGAVLADLLTVARSNKGRAQLLAVAAFGLVIADAALVHLNATKRGHYNNFAWVDFVRNHPHETFAAATYNTAISRSLPMLDGYQVAYIDPRQALDLFAPGRDGGAPRYLIYQPIERFVDFDAQVPSCDWRDWVTTLLRPAPPPSLHRSCIYGFPLPPTYKPQPSLDEIAALAPRVIERSDVGIGYVIVTLP